MRAPLKLLDKYLVLELAAPFGFGVALFAAILLAGNFLFKLIEYVAQYNVALSVVGELFLYAIPGVLVLAFPMGMLLGVLLAMGRLSSDSEYSALMAAGVGLPRIAAVFVVFSVIVGLVTLPLSAYLAPAGNSSAQRLRAVAITEHKAERDFMVKDEAPGGVTHIVYADELSPQDGAMSGVHIYRLHDGQTVAVIEADQASWDASRHKWYLSHGSIRPWAEPAEGGSIGETVFTSAAYPIDVGKSPEDMVRERKKPRDMTIAELRKQMRFLKGHAADTSLWATEYHDRFAVPFAAMVFGLLGTPLGSTRGRARGTAIGFGIAVAAIFIYYVLWFSMGKLGRIGAVPPALAAWLTNVVFLAAGTVLLKRASR